MYAGWDGRYTLPVWLKPRKRLEYYRRGRAKPRKRRAQPPDRMSRNVVCRIAFHRRPGAAVERSAAIVLVRMPPGAALAAMRLRLPPSTILSPLCGVSILFELQTSLAGALRDAGAVDAKRIRQLLAVDVSSYVSCVVDVLGILP